MKPKELYRSHPVGQCHGGSAGENKPRKPSCDETPIRPLSENWSEYMTAEKRFYYYNSLTGATSWKPPRITSSVHHHQFHHAHHHSLHHLGQDHPKGDCSSLENSQSSLILDSADPLENNNHHHHVSILREEEDYDGEEDGESRNGIRNGYPFQKDPIPTSSPLPHLPVPDGWSYFYDGALGQGFYVHDITGARVTELSISIRNS